MKGKIVSVLMLTLILTNVLGLAFIIKPSFAQDVEKSILDEPFMEKMSEATLPDKATDQYQWSDLNGGRQNILERKPDTNRETTSESSSQTSQNSRDRWNFNDTSEWGGFAYLDGNKTRLIVGVNGQQSTSLPKLEKIVAEHQAKIVNTVSIGGKVGAVVVELLLTSVTPFVEEVRVGGLASYIEPNMKVQAQLVPNDPYWSLQWGPQKIEADYAWNTTVGDPSVLVAVVDTGIDYTHPDLAANYVPLGYDWVNMDPDPLDDFGHGTHCAGIIAAVSNNNLGIAGLAQVRVMAEKVLDGGGGGYWDWVANGIINATDCGADIISLSLGGYGESDLLHEAVKYAYDAGVLVIAAAANDNTNIKAYPAGYDEVIAVAATDQSDGKAYFSNWGDWIELAAPGVSVYSTMPTYHVTLNDWGYSMNYDYLSGTSMACPHVSGVAALVWSLYPDKTRDWVRLWLRYTADDLGDPGFDVYYGYGRVNARKAVEQTPPAHELIAWEWETPPYVEPEAIGIINATILNFGENDETDITVQLLANGTMIDHTSISFLAGGHSTTVNLLWNPTVEGLYNLTLYVVPVPEETSLENNVLWKYIYVGFPVKAVVLHSAGNVYGDIITNWQALTNEWYLFGDTMVYIDYTTLNKEGITYEDIVATEADVLIISCAYDPYAGWQFTDSEIEAIERYVHEGHGLITTAGTLYYQVPNNNKLAPLFGLNETTMWSTAGTDLLHLMNTTHPIFTDVPDPLVFPQVVTVLPQDGRWDSNELVNGKYLALGHYQESAIVAYRGLVYISPWLEIIPPYYHHHLQLLYNAITWSSYQKPEHELAVSLETPARVKPEESTLLNATVSNLGLNNETDVKLQLFIDEVLVDSVTIPELSVDSSYAISYLWTPTVQGAYNITAYSPPVLGEEITANNVDKQMVMVLLITVKNALVYTDDSNVAPFSRYVIVALNNLGINYTHYADNPSGFGAALASQPWDLVIVDHYNYYAVGSYWTELEEYVRDGGRLVLSTFDIDGSHSEPTTLWDTLGVRWVSDMLYSPEPVYRWIPSHPIFTFPNSVGDITSYISWGPVDYGDHVAVTTGTPIAGFTTSPVEDYAAIVVGNTYPTVLFSFCLDDFRYDEDGDGKLDAIELWQNAIVYLARGFEHDLAVSIDAPTLLEPGDSVALNATVRNRGLSNETNVTLELIINGIIVDSELIPELLTGASHTIDYLWTPVEGTYNITAYAPPVSAEEFAANNVATKIVSVRPIKYVLFDQTHGTDSIYSYSTWVTSLTNRGYVVETNTIDPITPIVLEGYDVFVIPQAYSSYTADELLAIQNFVYNGGGLLVIGDDNPWIYTELTSFAGITWASGGTSGTTTDITLHPVTTGVTTVYLDAPVAIMYVTGVAQDLIRDPAHNIMLAVSEQPSGKVAGFADENTLWNYAISQADNLLLANNMIDWLAIPIRYEHDLAVSLDAPTFLLPGTPRWLNATVRNTGLNNETGVELQLLINGTIVDSVVLLELPVGESYEISHLWTPTVEGTYNVTAYAPPVPDEDVTTNNLVSRMVRVRYVTVALISDQSELIAITPILDSMGIGYDVYNDNSLYLYTEDLNLLLSYQIVIFNNFNREITSGEHTALQSYLSSGGNLLVTGYDSLGSPDDWLLADIVCSSSVGDNTGEPDLYVVDETHPIMNGPYGSFPAGYHISGLFSDCDAAEADTGRNAITVAELADGYDKIIATELPLGRVAYWNGKGTDDWIWNADCEAMLKNTLVWLTRARALHDLAVSLAVPASLKLGDSTMINATVKDRGLNNETDVELYLLINGTVVNSATIPELLVGESYTITYLWTPTIIATYNITAYAPPVTGEEFTANNVVIRSVNVWLVPVIGTSIFIDPLETTVMLGQNFTVSVNVANVTNLAGWQLNVTFNPAILNVKRIYLPAGHIFEGLDPMTPEPQIDNTDGYVIWCCLIGPSAPVDHFGDSGIMCQIEFVTIGLGISPIHLDTEGVFNTILVDPEAEDIPFRPIDGVANVLPSGLIGDINGDGKVDIKDLVLLTRAFGSYPSHPRWNSEADLNGDNKVDIKDLVLLIKNFGKTC